MKLAQFRAKYPQYDDLSDRDLAFGLYQKYYAANMSYNDFARKIEAPRINSVMAEAEPRQAAIPKANKKSTRGYVLSQPASLAAPASANSGALSATYTPISPQSAEQSSRTRPEFLASLPPKLQYRPNADRIMAAAKANPSPEPVEPSFLGGLGNAMAAGGRGMVNELEQITIGAQLGLGRGLRSISPAAGNFLIEEAKSNVPYIESERRAIALQRAKAAEQSTAGSLIGSLGAGLVTFPADLTYHAGSIGSQALSRGASVPAALGKAYADVGLGIAPFGAFSVPVRTIKRAGLAGLTGFSAAGTQQGLSGAEPSLKEAGIQAGTMALFPLVHAAGGKLARAQVNRGLAQTGKEAKRTLKIAEGAPEAPEAPLELPTSASMQARLGAQAQREAEIFGPSEEAELIERLRAADREVPTMTAHIRAAQAETEGQAPQAAQPRAKETLTPVLTQGEIASPARIEEVGSAQQAPELPQSRLVWEKPTPDEAARGYDRVTIIPDRNGRLQRVGFNDTKNRADLLEFVPEGQREESGHVAPMESQPSYAPESQARHLFPGEIPADLKAEMRSQGLTGAHVMPDESGQMMIMAYDKNGEMVNLRPVGSQKAQTETNPKPRTQVIRKQVFEPEVELGAEEQAAYNQLKHEIGREEQGGRAIVHQKNRVGGGGNVVVGRTSWIGSDFWRYRPGGEGETGARVTPEQALDAFERVSRDEPITTSQARFIRYARQYAREMANGPAGDRTSASREAFDEEQEARQDHQEALRREYGADIAPEDLQSAATVEAWAHRARSAGVPADKIESAMGAVTDEAAVRRLNALIEEHGNANQGTAQANRQESNRASRAGETPLRGPDAALAAEVTQGEVGGSRPTLALTGQKEPAARPRATENQQSIFGDEPKTQNAILAEQNRLAEAEARGAQVPPDRGGGLFSDEARQRDLATEAHEKESTALLSRRHGNIPEDRALRKVADEYLKLAEDKSIFQHPISKSMDMDTIAKETTTPPAPGVFSARRIEDAARAILPPEARKRVEVLPHAGGLSGEIRGRGERIGTLEGVEGMFDPKTNKVYLFANEITTPKRLAWVLLHELGHYGLHNLHRDNASLKTALNLARANPTVRALSEEIKRDRPQDKLSDMAATNEALAELHSAIRNGDWNELTRRYGVNAPQRFREQTAGTIVSQYIRALVRALNRTLTRLGFKRERFTDADVRDLLEDTWRVSREGRERGQRMMPALSRSQRTRETYDLRINELFADARPNLAGVKVLDQSDVLGILHHGDGPVYLAEAKVLGGRDNHPNFTEADWKKIPEWLDNPVAVFESDTHPERMVFFAPEKVNGVPVRMIVEPNSEGPGSNVHLLLNAYDSGTRNPFGRWLDDGLLRYANKKEAGLLGKTFQTQLSGLLASGHGLSKRILQYRDLVKYRTERAQEAGPGEKGAPQLSRSVTFDSDFDYSGSPRERPDVESVERITSPEQLKQENLNKPARSLFDENLDVKKGLFDLPRQKLQQRYIYLQRVQEAVQHIEGRVLEDSRHPLQRAELFRDRTAAEIEDFREGIRKSSIGLVQKAGVGLEGVDDWLTARATEAREAKIREFNPDESKGSGMSQAEADRILAKYKDNKAMQQLGELVDWLRMHALETRVNSGLMRADTALKLLQDEPHYVPLKGFRDEFEGAPETKRGTGKGFDVRNYWHRALGRSTRSASPLANMFADYEQTLVLANKNIVDRALAELLASHPDSSRWELDRITYKQRLNPRTGLVERAPDQAVKEGDSVIHFEINARPHTITMKGVEGERFARAWKNLEVDTRGALVAFLGHITRYLASVATSWNPAFILSNFFRDVQTAYVNLGDTAIKHKRLQVMRDIPKAQAAMHAILRGSDMDSEVIRYAREFRRHGGMTLWMDSHRDVQTITTSVAKQLRDIEQTTPRKVLHSIGKLVDDYNKIVENGTRLSAYIHARKAGLTPEQAAHLAKDLTVNFARKGEWGATLNSLYLFYNASIQGGARTLKAARNPAVQKVLAGIIAANSGLSISNRIVGGEDDDGVAFYDKIPEYIKERYQIIMLPPWVRIPGMTEIEGGGAYISFPLPYGYNVAKVLGDKIGDFASVGMGLKQEAHPLDSALSIGSATMGSFNPLGASIKVPGQLLAPTVADPLVQMWTGKTFYGADMYPDKNPFTSVPLPDTQRYWSSSSEPAKALSSLLGRWTGGDKVVPGGIDLSPITLDHLFESITGGTGRFAMRLINTGTKLAGGETPPVREVPFVRRLLGNTFTERWNRDRYYENLKHIGQAKKELDAAKTPQRRLQVRREWREWLHVLPVSKLAESEIRRLRKVRDEIDDSSLSASAKKREMGKIDQAINRVRLRLNKEVLQSKDRYRD